MDESRFVPDPVSSEPPDVSDLRCSDCHQLRRSLPRHTSGCRYAGQNCPGCAYAAEEHIASCPIASLLKLPSDTCCEGVDLPSIGHAHSPDCANTRRVVRASYTLPVIGKVQPPEDASEYRTGTTYREEATEPDRCWIIRRCAQRWTGVSLIYEDFPTAAGLMTKEEAWRELNRVDSELPDEFCAHRISLHCDSARCAGHIALRDELFKAHRLPSAADLDHVAEELAAAEATKAVGARPPEVNLAIADRLIDSAMRPAPDSGGRRDALLGELVFAARALAQSRIVELPVAPPRAGVAGCCECHEYVDGGTHAKNCRTGRVLKVLDELHADAEADLRPRLTVVIGGEGDARPQFVPGKPGFIARECQKCGGLDAAWQAQQMPEVEVQLDLLGLNQCVGAGIGGKGHTLYTHQCAQRSTGGAR